MSDQDTMTKRADSHIGHCWCARTVVWIPSCRECSPATAFNTLDVSGQNLHDEIGNVVGSVFTKSHYIHSTVETRGLQPGKMESSRRSLYQC